MSFSRKTGLDTLVDTPVDRVVEFALGANVIRSALSSSSPDFVVLPERGSMPIYWAAQGLSGMEKPIPVDELRLPIGTNISEDGHEISGLTKPEKSELIIRALAASGLAETGRATLLDEVQNGGTISFAARTLVRAMRSNPDKLSVIAAQDTLVVRSASTLAPKYKSLALNQRQDIHSATVVPIPLIATDKNPLLNTLVRMRSEELEVKIQDNLFSELACRTLGSIARRTDLLRPKEVLLNLLDSETAHAYRTVSEEELDTWVSGVVDGISEMQKRQ